MKKSSTYSVASNVKWKIFSNFVAFSEYLNFIRIKHGIENNNYLANANKPATDVDLLTFRFVSWIVLDLFWHNPIPLRCDAMLNLSFASL